jgi:tRNA (adenine37-N6)-methyltransferase
MRPNRLDVSNYALVAVEGLDPHMRWLDATEGTPILDVEPFLQEFEPTDACKPAWVTEIRRSTTEPVPPCQAGV